MVSAALRVKRPDFVLVIAVLVAVAGSASGSLPSSSGGSATGLQFNSHSTDARDLASSAVPATKDVRVPGSQASSQLGRASAAPPWPAFPPRKATAAYAPGEAPMGIVDTGQASTGPVSYNTSSFEGSVTIETLSVCAAASPCGSTELGFQLNAVLGFEDGGNWYAYWVQDVMVVDTGSHSVIGFEDNIWNFSDYGATMYSSTISGYGAVQSGVYAEGFEFPAGIYVYPGTYELILNTSVNADGQPIVQVMFDAGHGFTTYDEATFDFVSQLAYSDGFIVDGSTPTPVDLAYDVEWVLGGPGGGLNTIDESSNLQLGLNYWNGNNYETINNAKNSAEDTGETITSAEVGGHYSDANGSLFAQVSTGTETSAVLWYSTLIALVELQGPGSCNGTLLSGEGSIPFLAGNATIAVGATSLDFQVACEGYTQDFGTYTLAAGSITELTAGAWANVQLSETGLPSGLTWGVAIGTDQKSSDGVVLSFYLPTGSYTFTLSGGTGYLPIPSADSLSFGESGEGVSVAWELIGVSSTAGSGSVDVGQAATFSVTLAHGSVGDSFVWTGLPGGCSPTNSVAISCSPTSPANHSIVVKVTDYSGFSGTSSAFPFQVFADPAVTVPVGSPPSIDLGQTVTFTVTSTGGSGGDAFTWNGLPDGCHPVSSLTLSCMPTAVGILLITVSVTDSNGVTAASPELSFTIDQAPSVTLSVTPSSPLQSASVSFTASVSGGAGGFIFLWTGLPSGCTAPTDANLTCSPSSTGTYEITVNVTDQNGGRGSSSVNLTVMAAFLGLPAVEGYGAFALVVGLVAILGVVLVVRRLGKGSGQQGSTFPEPYQSYSPAAGATPPEAEVVSTSEILSVGRADRAFVLPPSYQGTFSNPQPATARPIGQYCPWCGTGSDASATFCHECGKPLPPL